MSKHLSPQERNEVLSVLAASAFAGTIHRDPRKWPVNVQEMARQMEELGLEMGKAMVEGVDPEQCRVMVNVAENSYIKIMPKVAAQCAPGKSFVIVETDVLERITANSLSDCMICDKEGKAIKKCQMRKDLTACWVKPRSETGCPYQGFNWGEE